MFLHLFGKEGMIGFQYGQGQKNESMKPQNVFPTLSNNLLFFINISSFINMAILAILAWSKYLMFNTMFFISIIPKAIVHII